MVESDIRDNCHDYSHHILGFKLVGGKLVGGKWEANVGSQIRSLLGPGALHRVLGPLLGPAASIIRAPGSLCRKAVGWFNLRQTCFISFKIF